MRVGTWVACNIEHSFVLELYPFVNGQLFTTYPYGQS